MGGFYSATKRGDQLTLSKVDTVNLGTGETRTGTISEQTSFVLENIKLLMEQGGSTIKDVTKIVAYTRDNKYCSEVREICEKYFQANSTIEISVIPDPSVIKSAGYEINLEEESPLGRSVVKEIYLTNVLMDATAKAR